MTTELFYPEFTPELKSKLSTLSMLIENNPDYLQNDACPYTHDEIELLKKLAPSVETQKSPYEQLDDDLDDGVLPDFEAESIKLFKEMKNFKRTLSSQDTAEMTSTFRTMVSLMEKILTVQERAAGINQYNEFKNHILDAMDRYLEPAQKSEFVEDLNAKLHQE